MLDVKMAVDGGCGDTGDWEGRWNHVKKFLERSGPFTHPDFEPTNVQLETTCFFIMGWEIFLYSKFFISFYVDEEILF
ncbi:hypothetical protein FD754_001664 [Muntiacus muntjak]|uniref:Uncharacterized protein n=1 Tax=Muntiacus muntjak TaxID=9888 RepID=A0A5N3W9A4_MUNMU|nr:hypothetical protein FD754_001664 [Muntiacus muntjak]